VVCRLVRRSYGCEEYENVANLAISILDSILRAENPSPVALRTCQSSKGPLTGFDRQRTKMHRQVPLISAMLTELAGKTAIVTGGAGGIGAATVKLMHSNGANVVIADLEEARSAAESLIEDLGDLAKAAFIPTNILDWSQMNGLFKETLSRFGTVDIVVANAGTMETKKVLDLDDVQEDGEPKEPSEAYRVIDINLKGTLNSESCLRGK
jgi:hypothetical protein